MSSLSPGSRPTQGPFALRSVTYTLVSVLLLFVALPLAFHLAGERFAGPTSYSALRAAIGSAVLAGGLAAYLYCAIWLMHRGRGPYIEFDPPRRLVRSGPYRWVRNPIVLSVLVTIAGEAVLFGSPGILGLWLLIVPVVYVQVTRIEEPLLSKRFGSEYSRYCAEVPRWLPRP